MIRREEQRLYERLGYTFAAPDWLRLGLTHKSFANENPQHAPEHNERLEFLGDAVLDFVISDLIMARFPDLAEGELSKLRASLVTESSLAAVARELELGGLILMGRGEEQSGGRDKNSILSNTLEALLAAVYLDSKAARGTDAAYGVIERLFASRIDHPGAAPGGLDFKTELQEWVQKTHKEGVRYRVLHEHGPDHEKTFDVAVIFRDLEISRGSGRSKKQAEQSAAKLALESLRQGGSVP
jgi:ribonuclease III